LALQFYIYMIYYQSLKINLLMNALTCLRINRIKKINAVKNLNAAL